MVKRISRSLPEVAKEVLEILKNEHGVTEKQLEQLKNRIKSNAHRFPLGGIRVNVNKLWIDYEVQRDVIIAQILKLLKKWDNRICQPAACNTTPDMATVVDGQLQELVKAFIYDAQHRCVTLCIFGYEEIYITLVVDDDPTFASYAFRESNSTIKKIGPPDFHRNNLRLFDLGVHDDETIPAKNLQDQFDALNIDFCEDSTRNTMAPAEKKRWYMSHFKYAQKPMGADKSGKTAGRMLKAIITAWPNAEKIQNGVYIGLHQMNEQVKGLGIKMPADWMTQVCQSLATSYRNPAHLEQSAERQVKALSGGQWNVPTGMFKFMREVYRLNGGTLTIPGDGLDLNIARGVWCDPNLVPNHTDKFKQLLSNDASVVADEEDEHEYA